MNEKVYIKDFIEMLKRNQKAIGIIMVVSVLTMVQLSFVLPKTFKSEFEINVYSQYFNNSMISELIPGINNSAEMTQAVDAMVKEFLSDDFIDRLGDKFNLYPKNIDDIEKAKQRQMLRDKFEAYTAGGTAYHIAFIHNDPKVTYEVSKEILEAVRNYFIDTRIKNIELAQQTILKKLESANVTKQFTEAGSENNGVATKNPLVLKAEIAKINQEISSLKMQFNASHPSIVKLEQRKLIIENVLKELGPTSDAQVANNNDNDKESYSPLLMSNDKETSKNITSKLYTNLNNINIALDIERRNVATYIAVTKSPQYPTIALFPKKRIFASLGFMIGLIFCFAYVFYKEIMRENVKDKAIDIANKYDSKYFGSLPFIDEKELMSSSKIKIKYKKTEVQIEYHPDQIDDKH